MSIRSRAPWEYEYSMKLVFAKYHSGVAALFVIVVVGASALLMAVGASFLGIGELTSGFVSARGDEMLALADGCLDEVLERVRYNPAITLAELAANPPPYPCTINAVSAGPLITVTVTASDNQYYKKIIATINPALEGGQLVSWTEVSN